MPLSSGNDSKGQGSPVLLQPHGLYVYELPDSIRCEFSTVPRMLHTAERHSRVGDDHLVQENHSCLEFVDETLGFPGIMGPGAGSQSEAAVIGDLYGLVHSLYAENRRDRSKKFFAIGR